MLTWTPDELLAILQDNHGPLSLAETPVVELENAGAIATFVARYPDGTTIEIPARTFDISAPHTEALQGTNFSLESVRIGGDGGDGLREVLVARPHHAFVNTTLAGASPFDVAVRAARIASAVATLVDAAVIYDASACATFSSSFYQLATIQQPLVALSGVAAAPESESHVSFLSLGMSRFEVQNIEVSTCNADAGLGFELLWQLCEISATKGGVSEGMAIETVRGPTVLVGQPSPVLAGDWLLRLQLPV